MLEWYKWHLDMVAWKIVQTSRSLRSRPRCSGKRYPMSMGIEYRIHQLIVAIYCAIIRDCICTWAVHAIEQAVIESPTLFSLGLIHSHAQEIITKTLHAFSRKDTEHISLRMSEFGWGITAESGQIFAQKCLYASQGQMSESRTVIEECRNALCKRLANIRTKT